MYSNNRRHHSHSNHENRDRHERQEHHAHPHKYNKGMILLKSTVFALFIVLVVSLAAFEIIKHRKEANNVAEVKCEKIKTIAIAQNIESLKVSDGVVTVLTKASSKGEQEVIRFSAGCGHELNRIIFKVQ